MSAYIVDPRTIDYLVQWGGRTRDHSQIRVEIPDGMIADVRAAFPHAESMGRLCLGQLTRDGLGSILMRENIRSVRYRYGDDGHRIYWGEDHGMDAVPPDDLPGPTDQSRVWNYRFRMIHQELDPAWVVSCADCLEYQSCETPDYRDTLAYAVLQGIRESAVRALTADAPWGVTDADLGAAVPA